MTAAALISEELVQRSASWWQRVSADPALINAWLQRQYRGELRAATRLRALMLQYPAPTPAVAQTLDRIIAEEQLHATWIGQLLVARGQTPQPDDETPERYWEQVLQTIKSWDDLMAVGAYAEEMRLARINAIVADPVTSDLENATFVDITTTFELIRGDEQFHARAFRAMASPEALARHAESHTAGAKAIGLER